MWQRDLKSPLKICFGPTEHLSLMRVCVWQMYLRLSAWPSLSIRPGRALTAVQRPLSMCRQTVKPVEVLSEHPSRCSFLWIFLICFSLYPSPPYFLPSLYLPSTNQSDAFSSSTARFTYEKPHLLFHRSASALIPAHSAPALLPLMHNTALASPAAPTAEQLHNLQIM